MDKTVSTGAGQPIEPPRINYMVWNRPKGSKVFTYNHSFVDELGRANIFFKRESAEKAAEELRECYSNEEWAVFECMEMGDRKSMRYLYTKATEGKKLAVSRMNRAEERKVEIERHRNKLSCALEDALKMFDGAGSLATEERIEGWKKILKENG